jgi:hypothetical protein
MGGLKFCTGWESPGTGCRRGCSFMNGVRGWWSVCRRFNMIRIGLILRRQTHYGGQGMC